MKAKASETQPSPGFSTPVAGLYAKRITFKPYPVGVAALPLDPCPFSGKASLAYEIKETATKL